MSVKIILSKTGEPAEKHEFVFDEETISLGREPSNLLSLPGSQVSKLHAQIARQGSEYYITDLNSTNSTYLNGKRLITGQQHILSRGDKISISDYELEVIPASTITSPPAEDGHRLTISAGNAPVIAPVHEPEERSPDRATSDVT